VIGKLALCVMGGGLLVALVSLFWRARAKARQRDIEAHEMVVAFERGVLEDAEKKRQAAAAATQNAIDEVPLMTDEQLEREINR
jgi:hypothetical protein